MKLAQICYGNVKGVCGLVVDQELVWLAEAAETVAHDRYFGIHPLQVGSGDIVLLLKGFGSRQGMWWGGYADMVAARFPFNPVARVSWNAKEFNLRDPTDFDPRIWHEAKRNAKSAGTALARIISQSEGSDLILCGFSLGGRVALETALALSSVDNRKRIKDVYLLGCAVRRIHVWESVGNAVRGHIYNYYSRNDPVLNYIFKAGSYIGRPKRHHSAVGAKGFPFINPKFIDIDVSNQVKDHHGYFQSVRLD